VKARLQSLTTASLLISASILHAEDARSDQPEQRAEATLRQMTLQEKISLLSGKMTPLVPPAKRPEGIAVGAGYVPGVARLGIPPLVETDASLGVSNLNNMRRDDVATALPSGLAMAATWNPALVKKAGAMIGAEARGKGFNVMLAGGVNLVRDPRAGRNFEYLGEDPLLAGRLVGAQIAGVQSNNIIATIKHFALNDQETGRASATVNIDEAAMRESDLLAFQIGIETGKPGSVMCAYNQVNGVFACENSFLLTDVLRRDWGYKGFVMSDWGSVHSTEALLAGLDQQSGEQLDRKRWFSSELETAVAAGRIPPAAIDTAASRILYAIYAHGLVENPPRSAPIDYAANASLARVTAEEGTVLLQNERNILPIVQPVKRIAVIGGHADIGVLSGGGSSQVTPVGGFSLVEKAGSGTAAAFAKRAYGGTSPLTALRQAMPNGEITFLDGKDRALAAIAAKNADLVIVFAEKFATEAEDHPDLSLGEGQDELIADVAVANRNTVVVLQTGNPVLMPWRTHVAAILAAWYPGQHGAAAIARVLTGAANPSGRLPITFPATAEQLPNPQLPGANLPGPSSADKITYGLNANSPHFAITYPEGSDAGYRWFDRNKLAPLYPFGHGLTYTSFRYDDLALKGGKTISVRFRVTNTGTRAGADVPQVYVTLPGKAKRLIGWDKPVLEPGQSAIVEIEADPRLLADFDSKRRHWRVTPGTVEVEVGRSAADAVLTAKTRLGASKFKP
jgi:beta-glucosidase